MRYIPILFVILICASCNNNKHEDDDVMARVYEKYLYSSELEKLIPAGTSPKDSLMLAKNFINNWVRQNLVIHQAERNLTEEQMDFEQQLESYRNSLIIYQYEKLLVEQKLDTVVSERQIQEYYEENQHNFELRENVLICNYIILDEGTEIKEKITDLLKSDEEAAQEQILFLCDSLGLDCYLNNQNWISFSELSRQIPIKTMDEENFIRNKSYSEIKEDPFIYLLRIRDFKIEGESPPVNYVKDDIKRVILNKRKTSLIKQMEEDMFNAALQKNEIDIY